jgi:hypothetical protein
MIIGWIRLAAVGYVILTIVYFIMKLYLRSVTREALEKQFDAGGIDGDRDHFVEDGMQRYEKGLKKTLLWLIYIIPTAAFAVIIYILNFQ